MMEYWRPYHGHSKPKWNTLSVTFRCSMSLKAFSSLSHFVMAFRNFSTCDPTHKYTHRKTHAMRGVSMLSGSAIWKTSDWISTPTSPCELITQDGCKYQVRMWLSWLAGARSYLFPVGGDDANVFGWDLGNTFLALRQQQFLQVVNDDGDLTGVEERRTV